MTHAPTTPARTALAILATAGGVFALAGAAHAQTPGELIIEVTDPVLAPGESTSVRLLAGFDSSVDYAVAAVVTDLLADSGGVDIAGALSGVALVHPMAGPGTTAGLPDSGGYTGIIGGQPNFPPSAFSADPTDPIAFWEATFTAPSGAGAFDVLLSTRTTRFEVYIERESSRWESRLDGLSEGAATITVIPAPAGALVLLGALAMRRRR